MYWNKLSLNEPEASYSAIRMQCYGASSVVQACGATSMVQAPGQDVHIMWLEILVVINYGSLPSNEVFYSIGGFNLVVWYMPK